jgi:LacI family transcriptional regulator
MYVVEKSNDYSMVKKQIAAWLSRHKPDVIVCHNGHMLEWVEEAGYRVPEEIGVVHLATDDDVSDWAGLTSNRREMGAVSSELVVSLVNSRQFGVPRIDRSTLIRGTWHPGRTLLVPKPE